jgi:hypothetical protein
VKARSEAAIEALRETQAKAAAVESARAVMRVQVEAVVKQVAEQAGARTVVEAFAAFGVPAVPGETEVAAYHRGSLLFHPDRQRERLKSCVDDDERIRVALVAEASFKYITELRRVLRARRA